MGDAMTIAAHPLAPRPSTCATCATRRTPTRAQHALAVVEGKPSLAPPPLWFALTESPYDDVRATVVANATKWRDDAPRQTLQHVWATALLAVHRGSTTKREIPRAIAERIASHPAEAGELLPILAIALRSVRPAERATALAALARAVHGNASSCARLARALIPELVDHGAGERVRVDLRYRGKSGVREHVVGHALTFEPNLSRSTRCSSTASS